MHDDNEAIEFWMVWREGTPTTRYRHGSKRAALDEAERLARTNVGDRFYVLKATAAVVCDEQPVRRLTMISDPIPF